MAQIRIPALVAVQDEGTRVDEGTGVLNFTGAGVSASWNSGSGRTDVSIQGVSYAGTGTIQDVGTSNAGGSSGDVARGDHVHDFPESVLRTVAGELTAAISLNGQALQLVGNIGFTGEIQANSGDLGLRGVSASDVVVNLGNNTATEEFVVRNSGAVDKLNVSGNSLPVRILAAGCDINVAGATANAGFLVRASGGC